MRDIPLVQDLIPDLLVALLAFNIAHLRLVISFVAELSKVCFAVH